VNLETKKQFDAAVGKANGNTYGPVDRAVQVELAKAAALMALAEAVEKFAENFKFKTF
jgi:hypothetical protein